MKIRKLLVMLLSVMMIVSFAACGGGGEEGVIDNRQWLNAILNGTEPLVKPEQALVVTQVLDAIYKAAATGKEVRF